MTAPTSNPALGPAFQLGIVVRDIEAAMQHWLNAMGVGPFIYMEDTGPLRCTYRGEPTDVKIHVAFTYSDNMQIELIQQRTDAPSPYRDFLASGREGLQHVAFYAHDVAAAGRRLEANGMRLAYVIEPQFSNDRVLYYEGDNQATMVEIVTLNPLRRRYHAALQAQTRGWEGDRPIRRYKTFMDFYEAFGLL
jgi:hypothetical protein